MKSVHGKVIEILCDLSGRVSGFVLEDGQEIRSTSDQLDLVATIVTLNARIQITGDLQFSSDEHEFLSAPKITNLDSNESAGLPAPVRLGKPGMLSGATPNTAASLAHHKEQKERVLGSNSRKESSGDIVELFLEKVASDAGQSGRTPNENSPRQSLARAQKGDAAAEIERAYDRLHSIQAILAYLNIMKRQVSGISQMHEEARRTYEQALAQYEVREFEGARELATASRCLSRVVESVIFRTLRSDSSYPSIVAPPPEHASTCENSSRVQADLNEVAARLSRIHWVMDNGTLPLEDRGQARRIAAWSNAFCQQAKRMYGRGLEKDAIELTKAANAAAHSAEHVCRNWYVARTAGSRIHMIPADHSEPA
jgi:hypothetical protein